MSGSKMDDSEQFKKLFIGGLHLQTTDQSLKAFYEKWGEVVDCIVMKDPNTRRSRGFGFITYSESHMVDDCLVERPHVIDGKQVDPKRAMPREEANKPELHLSIKKVFIGGIREPLDENDLREHFSKFGNIESIDMVTDKDTGKKRGFCFLTYDDTDSVDKIVLIKNHTIKNVTVEVKKAMERDGKGGVVGSTRGRGGSRGGMTSSRGGYGGRQGYGGDNYGGGYGSGYGEGYGYGGYSGGGWNQSNPGPWNQNAGYGNGYGGGYPGGGFGSGYGGGYGGGVMKNSGYTQRATGPYGGGYGSGSAGYGSGTAGPAAYGGGYASGGNYGQR